MSLFDKPKHDQCTIGCKNLYVCTFTCHNCKRRIINSNRCDDHRFSHEDNRTLVCSNCLLVRNVNIKCPQHYLKLAEVDSVDCSECKKKLEEYCNSDKFQVYENDNSLSICEECAECEESEEIRRSNQT